MKIIDWYKSKDKETQYTITIISVVINITTAIVILTILTCT